MIIAKIKGVNKKSYTFFKCVLLRFYFGYNPVYTNLRNGNKRCKLLFNVYIVMNFRTISLLSLIKVLRWRKYKTNQP